MKNPYTFRFPEPLFNALFAHLFPGDHDEHGAIIAAGICETSRGTRFLAREVFLAKDGVDYVPGKHGYRALSADFVLRVSDHCARENLCYFAVHCHGGDDFVSFSDVDLASHRRGYPALLDITRGGPVGALVFARNAVAGAIWTRNGVFELEHAVIVGPNLRWLHPQPRVVDGQEDPVYHRQSLIFGPAGQKRLAESKIGIIGAGGAGSLINQTAAHLGVGEIVIVDPDRIEPSNRPRVVGSTWLDAWLPFYYSENPWLRKIAWFCGRPKVLVARRVAKRANRGVRYHAVFGDITDSAVARRLRDVDHLFLCADTHQSRHVFNTLVHQYLLPGTQVGAKVPVEKATGSVEDIFTVSRPVLPYSGGGCLWCNDLIAAAKLQEEALSPSERKGQAYIEDELVRAPSVITLNAAACTQAANDFLLGFFGLLRPNASRGFVISYPRERICTTTDVRHDAHCFACGSIQASTFARGDRAELPCRGSGD